MSGTEIKEIKESHRKEADIIKGVLAQSEKDKSKLEQIPAETLEAILQEHGTSIKELERNQKAAQHVVTSAGLAVGEFAIPLMKKDKELTSLTLETKIGKDKLSVQFDRSHKIPDGNGGETTEYGRVVTGYTAAAQKADPNHKIVRAHLARMAEEALGD